jgi:trehalose 6-phosphate phosphatase
VVDLTPFTSQPAAAVVVTDFDGTLSPIVDDPATAAPLPGAVEVIHALARVYGRVAVVSGRPVAFLAEHLGTDVVLSGIYGLECMEGGVVTVHDEATEWVDVVDAMATRAEDEAPGGVGVERKGLSFTIHVRQAPQHLAWARSFAEAAAHATGLALHGGRMSFELRPPVEVDKGSVVGRLVDGAKAACFLGDDVGDLPAFDALDRLHADCGAHVLKVGVRSAEAPAELVERADVLVDGPQGALELLRGLLADR